MGSSLLEKRLVGAPMTSAFIVAQTAASEGGVTSLLADYVESDPR